MDQRATKLALARKKLQDHQEKKSCLPKVEHESVNQKVLEHLSDNGKEKEYQNNNEMQQESNNNQNQSNETDVNIAEILIASKRQLELQVNELQSLLLESKDKQSQILETNSKLNEHIQNLEFQIEELKKENSNFYEQTQSKSESVQELEKLNECVTKKNNNILEQLEVSNNMLSETQSENSKLKIHIAALLNEIDVMQVQFKQINNGTENQVTYINNENIEHMKQKIVELEQQLKILQKEKEHLQQHYEHFVKELNDQLKFAVSRNEELVKSVNTLSDREKCLVEQLSDMEIRLQNFQKYAPTLSQADSISNSEVTELQQNYKHLETQFQELQEIHEKFKVINNENEVKIKELSQEKAQFEEKVVGLSKLNSDIASDKIAVQRATEQNKKMKTEIQKLEEAFVKISNDKLELIEKLQAEKYLNRELTLKLSEIEDKAKNLHTKLIAKDEEMIRLQICYRDINAKYEELLQKSLILDSEQVFEKLDIECDSKNNDESNQIILTDINPVIPKKDAMSKLQERFLKIMDEVANLSDEKHRLEHIILQLQNETDTICEYVALYQQQRSILKQRDEERSAQIKIYQTECELLKNKLKELNDTFESIRRDDELVTYFRKKDDLAKIINLLGDIRNSALIDPKNNCHALKDFYPCNCCSGQLIDV